MGNPKLIPYETIVRVTSGDPEAVEEVLRHYSRRIRLAMIIHPITFYCSPFFSDMSTPFYQLAKIIPITDIPFFRKIKLGEFFCKLLLSSASSVILFCITV